MIKKNTGKKIGIIHGPGWGTFIKDISAHLAGSHEVRSPKSQETAEVNEIVAWADLIWLEWANEHAIYVTNRLPVQDKPVVCRIHGYEIFFGFFFQIDWSKINRMIFVSEYVRKLAMRVFPQLLNWADSRTIPNGVDLDRFRFKERGPGFNLAVVGDIDMKKNPSLWLEIMNRLVRLDRRFTLKVAGEITDRKAQIYLENLIARQGLNRNVLPFGYIRDIPAWFDREKINYLLTTSYFESFGYTIAEGMALGCRPLIHAFPGAEEVWPADCLFGSVDELVNLVQGRPPYDSHGYRRFVEEKYSLPLQLARIDALLMEIW